LGTEVWAQCDASEIGEPDESADLLGYKEPEAIGVGSLLPLLAARLGFDPALVSGPAMRTLMDATGLFICFTFAGIILGL
jgi:hypothetical protein